MNLFYKINSFLKRKHAVCRTFEMTHVSLSNRVAGESFIVFAL
jgi:hypothetical protein